MDNSPNETIKKIYKSVSHYYMIHIISFIIFLFLVLILFYYSSILKYNIFKYEIIFSKNDKCKYILVNSKIENKKYIINNSIKDKMKEKNEFVYVINLYNQLTNLLKYIKKQLFLINKYTYDKKINDLNYSDESIKNKLKILKSKQNKINKIYSKIEKDYDIILEKVSKGIKYNKTIEKENKDDELYKNKKIN